MRIIGGLFRYALAQVEGTRVEGLDESIELSLDWILKNRYTTDHPDPNLAGAVVNTRLRHRMDKLWFVNRDVGSTLGVRFLASYYDYTFGDLKK